ncbi:MAG: hypothetical protein A3B47_03790 [Candidatus Levybacteria bacterium RIFCSPLOWO2_01_FULL_39_24]|nr:MAG: hypothetical protein A2800_03595 [Candidatus Levybacteria bacterium RIFCSPHIGHO2_01_FULL_40_16]OGH46357.1 MAG: hypothetical protein A3B47_03790 [Candidatus Levybacteria bacterium RIFCSPLOWO2_01_FULL_39_24]
MKIDVYVMVYNEEFLLPYFLKHYGSFAQNIYAFYDESPDNSRKILSQHPKVTIFDLKEHGLNEGYWISKLWTKYEELSRGKADWVVLVDADEFLYHPNLMEVLKREKKLGTQLIQPQGFTMFSETLPTTTGQIYDEVKNGLPDYWATQCVLFDPAIYIRFRNGCHSIAELQGNTSFKKGEEIGVKMLHYRYFGRKYLEDRDTKNFSRYFIGVPLPTTFAIMRWKNKKHQLPDKTRGNRYEWFEKHKSEAYNVVDNMTTSKYILNKYQLKKNQSRHKLYRSREGSLSVLFRELGFNLGAEIGVGAGKYAKFLCAMNPNLKLFAIDAWESNDDLYNRAKARLESFNCKIIRDTSANAAKKFADNSLDFVFIDAGADYKSTGDNIKEWSKKVRKGGIIAGYNYNNELSGQPNGVKKAVSEWVKKKKIRPLFIFNKDAGPTWFYAKGTK